MAAPTTCPAGTRIAPLARLSTTGARVPLVDGRSVPYVNLDYAASAPPLDAVTEAVGTAAGLYASVHRGAGWASQVSTAAYEQARRVVGAFVGAREDDVVVLTRNTTDALTLLASAVPGTVVHLDVEHHANLLPWRSRRTVPVRAADTLAGTIDALDAALAAEPVALLAVTGASNVTGETLPLRELADLAHRHGARIAVDAAQLVAHRRVDVAGLGLDYLAFSGHKLYAPFGSGALVGRRDWLDAAPPYQPGGGAVREVTLTGVLWGTTPARHEGGTPNILGAIALATACTAVGTIGFDAIHAHEDALRTRLTDGLRDLGCPPLRLWGEGSDAIGVATFHVPGLDAETAAATLSAEHGIGVRDGRFCAHPLLARLGVPVGAVRASLGLGAGSDDVDALLAALADLVEHGPRWTYARGPAGVVPVPDPRPVPGWAGGVAATTAAECLPVH